MNGIRFRRHFPINIINPNPKLFEENIRLLGMNSPETVQAVHDAVIPEEKYFFYTARNGQPTAHWLDPTGKKHQIHSAYDPLEEARRYVRVLNLGFGEWVAWFGPGLWYGVHALMEFLFHCPVCVVEADPAFLRAVMERLPLQNIFSNQGLRVYTGSADAMKAAIRRKPIRIGWAGNYIEFPAARSMNPDVYDEMVPFFEQMAADTPPHVDTENVVRREVFGGAAPEQMRLVLSTNHRYAGAVRQTLAPLGVEARCVYEIGETDAVAEFNPTCYLTFTENLRPGSYVLLKLLSERGIPIIMWNLEDPKFFENESQAKLLLESVKLCECVFTHTEQYIDRYEPAGKPVYYLPTGARPDMYGDPLPDSEMKYDFSFFGFMNRERTEFLAELSKLLPDLKSRIVGPGLSPEDYREMIRRTRVNLTIFTTCDIDKERPWALSDRVWEVPYAGGFLLQDRRKYIDRHFAAGEIAAFEGVEECAAMIRYYATNPAVRLEILNAARVKIRKEHLWAHRVEKILEVILTLPGMKSGHDREKTGSHEG
jgi:hypothetical protein